MTADPPATAALRDLRRHLAALLSQVDTATLPQPDKVHSRRAKHPGCEWNAGKGWLIRTVEDSESAGFVYVDHDCGDLAYRWGPGDWESMSIENARRVGLAFLAAAHRAEETFAGVSRLPATGAAERPESDDAAPVRPMKRRPR